MPATIRAAELSDLTGYHACLSAVALERRYIGFATPPSVETSEAWMRHVVNSGDLFLVACDDSHVVGWCDAARIERDGFRHRAELGMGLLPAYRGAGLGSCLVRHAIDWAVRQQIERLELQVFASNVVARAVYAKFGFVIEGIRTRARKLDEVYDDVILMVLLLDSTATTSLVR